MVLLVVGQYMRTVVCEIYIIVWAVIFLIVWMVLPWVDLRLLFWYHWLFVNILWLFLIRMMMNSCFEGSSLLKINQWHFLRLFIVIIGIYNSLILIFHRILMLAFLLTLILRLNMSWFWSRFWIDIFLFAVLFWSNLFLFLEDLLLLRNIDSLPRFMDLSGTEFKYIPCLSLEFRIFWNVLLG